ncbi:MAG: thioredoxin domain-containing protein, partial [Pseudomonadota bacterium]
GVGGLLSIGLLIYSITLGVFCPTCLLFYVFVAISAYLAFARLRPEQPAWLRAALHDLGLLLIVVAVLLYPGLQTPKQDLAAATLAKLVASSPGHHDVDLSQDPLAKFLQDLEPQVQQIVSDARALYRTARFIESPVDIERVVSGNPKAPVHLIDWVDIRCPHCRNLDEALNEIRGVTPDTSWTEESRHFPLDSECNRGVSHSDGSGVACLSAKLLICLAGSPKGNLVRTALFNDQRKLTTGRVWEIAAEDQTQRASLEKCLASPETAAALRRDIERARQHGIEGTPLLVINGRQAPAFPPFIFAMIIAAGDSNAAGFRVLPPPRPEVLAR